MSHLSSRTNQDELSARISSYELAFKMQQSAPELVDIRDESQETLDLYGIGNPQTDDFGRRCLMARRMVERGVRFIQLYSGGAHNDDNWDAHGDLETNHNLHAGRTDKPIAGLLQDLKRTGLLDSTLIVWGESSAVSLSRSIKRRLVAITIPMALPCGWRVAVSKVERP